MKWLGCIGLALLFISCKKDVASYAAPDEITGFLPLIQYPEDNQYTVQRAALGRKLFFDTRFSSDGMVSCGSCHSQERFFADDQPTSPGAEGADGTRNSPSLLNVAYHPYFTREGGVPTLEMQVLVPIQEHNEFNSNMVLIAEELNADDELRNLSLGAYDEEITPFTITRALANFERTLLSFNARIDQAARGELVPTAQELYGQELFFSEKTQCGSCHSGFNFSSYEIVNNGLYRYSPDPGLARLTGLPTDSGKFKVASLRNVEMTAPYMHDGSMWTLEEVVEHYNSGGKGHASQDPRIQPLGLNSSEKEALVAFLRILTDSTFEMP